MLSNVHALIDESYLEYIADESSFVSQCQLRCSIRTQLTSDIHSAWHRQASQLGHVSPRSARQGLRLGTTESQRQGARLGC